MRDHLGMLLQRREYSGESSAVAHARKRGMMCYYLQTNAMCAAEENMGVSKLEFARARVGGRRRE